MRRINARCNTRVIQISHEMIFSGLLPRAVLVYLFFSFMSMHLRFFVYILVFSFLCVFRVDGELCSCARIRFELQGNAIRMCSLPPPS